MSQILNGHRSLGEKAALNLEQKIGLTPGGLVNPNGHGPALIEGEYTRQDVVREAASAYLALQDKTTPRAVAVIEKLATPSAA